MAAHRCQSKKIKETKIKIKKNKNWKNEKNIIQKKTPQNYRDPWVPNLILFYSKNKKTKLSWPMSAKSDT